MISVCDTNTIYSEETATDKLLSILAHTREQVDSSRFKAEVNHKNYFRVVYYLNSISTTTITKGIRLNTKWIMFTIAITKTTTGEIEINK